MESGSVQEREGDPRDPGCGRGGAGMPGGPLALQGVVFGLVSAAFTTIYITQPVLPVLRSEFGVDATTASYTIAAVVLGIALANLPFGLLSDRYPVRPIILVGGIVVGSCSVLCALSRSLPLLVAARFVQGLFIPALTTCLAAFLARTLPVASLNIVMGSYVSATVAGGLGGRLLGGWIHPPLHWRYAFVSSGLLVFLAVWTATRFLPRETGSRRAEVEGVGFGSLLTAWGFLRIYGAAFASFFVFSSVFNYLPFYLAGPPFGAPTEVITFMYLSYIIGIIMGPLAGKCSNRIGNGPTMALGSILFGLSIGVTLIPSIPVVMLSLAGICAGFFAVHASASGSLNRKLQAGRGRANSLYVLFYYLGGAVGIWMSGHAYARFGWHGVAALGGVVLGLSLISGIQETLHEREARANP